MALGMLILFSVLFAVTHIGMSHDPLRAGLVEKMGEKGFQGVYSLVSLATFGVAVWLFVGNRGAGPQFWPFSVWLYPVIYLLMILGFLLFVLSMATPSPTGMMPKVAEPRGVLRVTRHPMNMGFACFGLAHMIANGYLPDLFFFGSLFVVGFFGSYHQDRRKARERGEAFVTFSEKTSIFPFAAIAQGKNRLELKEFRMPFVAVAILALVVVLFLHERFFGVRPF